MPIPAPGNETEQEYISSCIREIIGEYTAEGQAYAVCKSTWDKENMSKEEFWTWDECVEKMLDEYDGDEEIANKVCGAIKYRNQSSEEFSKVKFEFPCKFKEKMPDYMSRCMSNVMVRGKYKSRSGRAGFCYSQYQKRYITNIGKNWK